MDKFVKCPRCGWKNPDNQVFCLNCHRIMSEMEANAQRGHMRHVKSAIELVVVLAVLACLGIAVLALLPRKAALGEAGGVKHAVQMPRILSALHRATESGTERGGDLREADVNAYITHLRLKDLPFDQLSLDFLPGRVKLRATSKLASWTVAGYSLAPTISRDFTLSVKDGEVVVEKASVGHLPMVWAFRPGSFARFMRKIHAEPEIKLLAKANSITLKEDRLHITFGEVRTAEQPNDEQPNDEGRM